MKMRNVLLASAIGLYMAAPTWATDLATDAKSFGARDAVIGPDLSADGSQVIYVTPGPGRKSIAVIGNLDAGKFSTIASSDGNPEQLRWCNFVSATRSVCQIGGGVKNNLFEVLSFSRLVSLNNDGSDPKLLGQTDSVYDAWLRQVDAQVVDWLDGTDNKVLVEREYVPEEGKMGTHFVRTKKGVGVDRIDVRTLRSDAVESPRDGVSNYMSDGRGHVRLMSSPDISSGGMLSGKTRYSYRTADSRDWKTLGMFEDDQFQPLAVDTDSNQLYVLKKKSGRFALYGIRMDGSMVETLVAENPRVDIDDVVRFGDGQRVIGYTYVEDKRTTVYFDPEFKALADSLSRVLPQLPLVGFVDASHDGRKLLIHAGSDSDPGRYYVFDRDKKTLTPAMVDRPELEGRALASVKPVTITAPDGTPIPAYLTLPPGKAAKGLPAVILPHGGPSSRDEWGFDWLSQFLAARGYAVLQPEYRGSAGFGDAWLNENGFRNWRTSIGDITASTKWLAAQGIADPDRTAILGWSYGGYAALQSAATQPGLYKAVVAVAPVTDLAMLKDDFRDFTISRIVDKEIGTGPHVADGSPLRHAAEIRVPVLLVHGDMDTNVKITHSQKMDAALKAAGHQSELVTFAGLDHQLRDSDARAQS
ncbi:S9 family peptidase [Sphingomonas limnosediminicola]|uniref:S9 family peptidase n=1 Tax=Sphingomonas limnosediminicola TaxID=940133 RepID=A0ABP7KWQ3_9SPHN